MAVMEDLTINFEVELSALDQAKGKLENVKEGLGNLKKALLGLSAVIGSVGAASGLLLKNSASEGAKWEKLAKQTNMMMPEKCYNLCLTVSPITSGLST